MGMGCMLNPGQGLPVEPPHDARAGGFKAVMVWNSDRFSRGDVTETEHHRFLLRKCGVKVLSVTEDYLAREGIDGDVLRT